MSALRKQKREVNSIQLFKVKIGKPILIVEDSKPLADMLANMITQQWECEVHIARTYAEAKTYLNKFRYDYHLAICDLLLPDAANAEIVDLVNKANVQFIAMSGNYQTEMAEQMLNKGAIDFIDKNNINAYQYVTELVGRLYKNHEVKVLVVDDSKSASQVITHMLEMQNFQVLKAKNGVKALETLEENKDIKVILTDYAMPQMDGIELVITVRKSYSKEYLSIIGLSGSDCQDLSSSFIKNGANDFLLKPYSYNELLCRINQNVDMLEYMEYIRNLANRDYMTQVYNRRYFFTEGQILYQYAKEQQTSLIISMIDIDHFKQVNDNYGHDCGDIVLIHFTQSLNSYFGQYLVARLGGEEFAVLFRDVDYARVWNLLDKFRQDIQNTPIKCNNQMVSITISIGVNQQLNNDIDAMLKTADECLYKAKHSGRNQVIG